MLNLAAFLLALLVAALWVIVLSTVFRDRGGDEAAEFRLKVAEMLLSRGVTHYELPKVLIPISELIRAGCPPRA